jgi:hypothetical protein
MKQKNQVKRLTITLFFTIVAVFPAFGQVQNILEAERCFSSGDYSCAIEKYKEIVKTATGQDKMIVQEKLNQAEKCEIFAKTANQAFNAKNWNLAKENYLEILKYNRNDANAIERLKECENRLQPTLSVSKNNLPFLSSGGDERVNVNTNAKTYSVGGATSWCKVKEHEGYFVVSCDENSTFTERTVVLTVTAGSLTERINVRQEGKTVTLTVSKEKLSFSSSGGGEKISVSTNQNTFSPSDYPSWCTVKKNTGYFDITCSPNSGNEKRTGFIIVTAGNKSLRINIEQDGKPKCYDSQFYLAWAPVFAGFPSTLGTSIEAKHYFGDYDGGCFSYFINVGVEPGGYSPNYDNKRIAPLHLSGGVKIATQNAFLSGGYGTLGSYEVQKSNDSDRGKWNMDGVRQGRGLIITAGYDLVRGCTTKPGIFLSPSLGFSYDFYTGKGQFLLNIKLGFGKYL